MRIWNADNPDPKEIDWESRASFAGRNQHFHTAARLYGSGVEGIAKVFGEAPSAPTPWPSASRSKAHGLIDPEERDAIHSALSSAPSLSEVDPRAIFASQPSVVRHHLNYYMGSQYELTGATSADQSDIGNRFPVVLERTVRDVQPNRIAQRGTDLMRQRILLSGHHRATAALLRGQPLRAVVVRPHQ